MDKALKVISFIATYILPGLGTLYFTISSIWGLPYAEQVVGTITAVVTFINFCMGFRNSRHNKNEES